uniref:Zinc finger protein 26 n=1 Tax=Cacopsylla melanoneura TaxID=428564 RepID=A0A8D8Z6F1_9HEMI
MLTHTGERPHACDICGSTFKDEWYLGVHMRKHNGEKPYKCNFCGEHFAARPAFTLHLKKHVGQKVSLKSLVCQVCNLSFGSEEELTSHYPEHFHISAAS